MKIIGTCISCSHKYCAKKVSLFESFSNDDLSKVLSLIERYEYEKGDHIFDEGDPFDRLYIVNGGSFKIFRYNKEGKEQILYVLSDGEFIGDLNLLKKDILSFNAVALEKTYLCTIKKDAFDSLMQEHPEMYHAILASAYDRIMSLENLVQTLTVKDVETRLASLLVRLAENFGIRTKEGIKIEMTLTREEMASYVGLTRETISRKLSKFQTDGLIELYENKVLLILDYDELVNLSEL